VGLGVGNSAARQNALLPLVWLHAVLPGLLAAWVMAGSPGLPHGLRRRLSI
jgi:lipopolysaccharide export system permease protein